MRYELSERVETGRSHETVMELALNQFKKISGSTRIKGNEFVAKNVEATFGSINRTDFTVVKAEKIQDGWLLVADVEYRPSGWFWIFLIVLLFTYIGWIIPIVFYLMHKSTVKSAIEAALRRVSNELRERAPAPQVAGGSSIDELERLAGLKDRGHITDEEFAARKAQLLR